MRFLVDAQLPPALARWLDSQGHKADHVFDLGMAKASDREIWQHAQQTNSVIITKDEDFIILQSFANNSPPILWIRFGNTTRHQLLTAFARLLPDILQALSSGEKLIG